MHHAHQPFGAQIDCDVCIIGGGSAGLSAAAGAAQLGARVVLIERGAMGGDCLNTGCVPSKSLIAAAHAAHAYRTAYQFGAGDGHEPIVDYPVVHQHVHDVISEIAPHDSAERFESLGVTILRETATFTSPTEVAAGPHRVRARRFALATGSRAVVPSIPGLQELEPLTNETVFDLRERPEHLLIVGGGPIGLEMAQAFRRLGSEVTLADAGTILPRDEPEAAVVIRNRLRQEGVTLYENAKLIDPRRIESGVAATIQTVMTSNTVVATNVLVAAGRRPNTENLGLEAAGIRVGPKGVEVDARLRTTNHRVFALGDVAGGPQFTHIAGYHGGIFVRNALFGQPAKVDYSALPWVTYLDPEVAHVGATEAQARSNQRNVTVISESFEAIDRAQAEKRTEGFIKLVLEGPRVLGATIVAPHAGEMISLWGLAISGKVSLSTIASMIAPYPTLAEISKRAAGSYYRPKVFSSLSRALVGFVQKVVP